MWAQTSWGRWSRTSPRMTPGDSALYLPIGSLPLFLLTLLTIICGTNGEGRFVSSSHPHILTLATEAVGIQSVQFKDQC